MGHMNRFKQLCTPAKIYFAIAVIASLLALWNGFGIMYVVWKMLFAFVWTYILGVLCRKGFGSLSWFLVLLPYLFMLLSAFGIYHIGHEFSGIMRMLRLQGAYGQEAMTNISKEKKGNDGSSPIGAP